MTGAHVEGDKNVPATKWWNHLWLVLAGWKTMVVFQVMDEAKAEAGYRVGYKDKFGRCKVCHVVSNSRKFKMLIGHEGCTFFAVDLDGNELPILALERLPRDSDLHAGIPQF